MARTIACLVCLALMFAAGAAAALPIDRNLLQLKHTRWTTDDGAPDNIRALAQSADGYLWIGSGAGLFRFDGQTFERISTIGVENAVTALVSTRRGDLWAGLQNGHILLIHKGRQTDVTPGFRGKRVRQLVEDRSGGVWMLAAGSDVQLARYADGRWSAFAVRGGIPPGSSIKAMRATRDGSLWIVADTGARVLRPGSSQFESVTGGSDSLNDVVEDRAGRIWAADHLKGLSVMAPPPGLAAQEKAGIAFTDAKNEFRGLVFDNDGGLWGLAHSSGVFRIRISARNLTSKTPFDVESFTQKDGLSSDFGRAILEDREHNVWVGTSLGLDRFRPANVVLETQIPEHSPYGYIVFNDHRGVVYVADSDTLYKVAPGGAPVPILRKINNPQTLCEDSDGDIWLAATGAMYRVHNDVANLVSVPAFSSYYKQCKADARHNIWFLTGDGDFRRYDGRDWTLLPLKHDTQNGIASLFDFDTNGRFLIFYENKGLAWGDPGNSVTIWPTNQIPGERIGVFDTAATDLLVGTVSGLARVRGDRVEALSPTYPWLRHVTGMARTRQGATWLQSSAGLIRVPTQALEAAFDRPGSHLEPLSFDARDGLTGANQVEFSANGAAVGGDGRIWFTTVNSMVWIDPARLVNNLIPPPIDIRRVVADGRSFDHPSAVHLTPGTKSLEIDYTALSLTIPERVAFRYRLKGADDRWVDPGARRQAIYQNLAPGTYTFTVIAANNDGVWNKEGATVQLILPPTFLQSWMFKLLCVMAALLLLWTLYRIRLNRITARLREQLDTRLVERERIARELHDTLLQGVHGLILRFQGIADRLPPEQVPGRLMEKALERAEELLVEGRERVHGLRTAPLLNDLRSSLAQTAAHAALTADITLDVRETGTVRAVDPLVHEELVWIVREALSNVVRHADATAVEIRIAYHWNRLVVSVSDNGKGIQPRTSLDDRHRHFGLIGMRERARRIAAKLDIGSGADNSGARVIVTTPARTAYPSNIFRRVRALMDPPSSEAIP